MGMNPRGRSRGHNHNSFNNNRRFNNGPNRNTVYDSIGPAGRLRGTAFQLMEKYLSAAKELMSSDRVAAENCLQHADHYMRINALAIAAEGARFSSQSQSETENSNTSETQDQPMAAEANQPVLPPFVENEPVVVAFTAEPKEEKEPDLSEVMKMDLSVPVSAIVENEMKARRGRPVTKKAENLPEGEAPAPVKRRGRPSKKAAAAEA